MQEKNLKLLRREIDLIDDQLLKLITQRSSVVERIGILKQGSVKVVDKNREVEILSRVPNINKAKKLLSYEPKFDLEHSIRSISASMKD